MPDHLDANVPCPVFNSQRSRGSPCCDKAEGQAGTTEAKKQSLIRVQPQPEMQSRALPPLLVTSAYQIWAIYRRSLGKREMASAGAQDDGGEQSLVVRHGHQHEHVADGELEREQG